MSIYARFQKNQKSRAILIKYFTKESILELIEPYCKYNTMEIKFNSKLNCYTIFDCKNKCNVYMGDMKDFIEISSHNSNFCSSISLFIYETLCKNT